MLDGQCIHVIIRKKDGERKNMGKFRAIDQVDPIIAKNQRRPGRAWWLMPVISAL